MMTSGASYRYERDLKLSGGAKGGDLGDVPLEGLRQVKPLGRQLLRKALRVVRTLKGQHIRCRARGAPLQRVHTLVVAADVEDEDPRGVDAVQDPLRLPALGRRRVRRDVVSERCVIVVGPPVSLLVSRAVDPSTGEREGRGAAASGGFPRREQAGRTRATQVRPRRRGNCER